MRKLFKSRGDVEVKRDITNRKGAIKTDLTKLRKAFADLEQIISEIQELDKKTADMVPADWPHAEITLITKKQYHTAKADYLKHISDCDAQINKYDEDISNIKRAIDALPITKRTNKKAEQLTSQLQTTATLKQWYHSKRDVAEKEFSIFDNIYTIQKYLQQAKER